jgi:hypothetical protein
MSREGFGDDDKYKSKIPLKELGTYFRKKYSNIISVGMNYGKTSASLDFNFSKVEIEPTYSILEKLNPFTEKKECTYQHIPVLTEMFEDAVDFIERTYHIRNILVTTERGRLKFEWFEEEELETEKKKKKLKSKIKHF